MESQKQRTHYKKKKKKRSYLILLEDSYKGKLFQHVNFHKKTHTGTQKEEKATLCQKCGLTDHSCGVLLFYIMLRAIPEPNPVALVPISFSI